MFRTTEESPNCLQFFKHLNALLPLICSSLICSCQHGFVIDGLNKKLQAAVIYIDFSKAFDSVSHSLLLFNLDQLGFPNNLSTWISSYLNCRSHRTKLKNSVSKMIYVTSGVPQGCQLGPLLFTLFIKYLPSNVTHSRVLMYADDA